MAENQKGPAFLEIENTTEDRIMLIEVDEVGANKEPAIRDFITIGIAKDRVPPDDDESLRDPVRMPSPFVRIPAERVRNLGKANIAFLLHYINSGKVRVHAGRELIGA